MEMDINPDHKTAKLHFFGDRKNCTNKPKINWRHWTKMSSGNYRGSMAVFVCYNPLKTTTWERFKSL